MAPQAEDGGKQALRLAMRRVRMSIPDRAARSELIWAEVAHLCDIVAAGLPPDHPTILTVMAFQGAGSEPDTSGLVELLEATGYTVLLPRVEGDRIVAVSFSAGDELRLGRYGIAEPVGAPVDPRTIDVVLVPGLAFTLDGRRLGQGGGFYDRFLPALRPDCLTVGVAFREQIVDDVPVEAHDRKLSHVVFDPVPE